MRPYTFVDLFCGAGGFTEGVLLSGGAERRFELKAASDVHRQASATHTGRFQRQLGLKYDFITKDIRDDDFVQTLVESVGGDGTVDLVVGGPPCQGFSLFGARKQDDPRNDLFRLYLKAIAALKPRYFVMENVPGLAMMYGGETVREMYRAVEAMTGTKYHLEGPIKVNAAKFGVPQARDRLLFIGSRSDVPVLDVIPEMPERIVTAREALDDLGFLRSWETATSYHESHPASTQYQEESRRGRLFKLWGLEVPEALTNHEVSKHTPDVIARFAMMQPGCGFDSIPSQLWDAHLHSSKKWCMRLDPDKPAYTVTTLPDDFVHYRQHRILTVREWARLQSFDDTFVFTGARATGGGGKGNKVRAGALPQYTQVGNAVPPLLAQGIGRAILQALDGAALVRHSSRRDLLPQIH